jgi:hypothetical protein
MYNNQDFTRQNKSIAFVGAAAWQNGGTGTGLYFVDHRPQSVVQKKQVEAMRNMSTTFIQRKENKTGLPDQLKSGIENLSGHSMDDVKVHYNSDKPAQLSAHAYAQGTDIHIASGQEKHLPHEAWHVVQQKQGRVRPTIQMKGKVNVNDDKGLEKEADVMGAKASIESRTNAKQFSQTLSETNSTFSNIKHIVWPKEIRPLDPLSSPIQRLISFDIGGQVTFKDIPHLKSSLKVIYTDVHHNQIDKLVDDAEALRGRPIGAIDVFKQIINIAKKENWTRVFVALPSKGHGPSLPIMDAHQVSENRGSAMSAFMYTGITVARAELTLPDGSVAQFEGKEESSKIHAESVLIKEIDQYLANNKVDPSNCNLKITISNAPCGTGPGEQDCSSRLAAYQKEKGFGKFRLYFMNPFGPTIEESVNKMRTEGIKVSPFTPKTLGLKEADYSKGTWAKMEKHEKYHNPNITMDDWSGDESPDTDRKESEPLSPRRSTSVKDNKMRGKRNRSPAAEQRYPSLDYNRLFNNIGEEIFNGPVELNGYQVGELLKLFKNPIGKIVTYNEAQLRIVPGTIHLPKTEYNPDGLSIRLVVRIRGG